MKIAILTTKIGMLSREKVWVGLKVHDPMNLVWYHQVEKKNKIQIKSIKIFFWDNLLIFHFSPSSDKFLIWNIQKIEFYWISFREMKLLKKTPSQIISKNRRDDGGLYCESVLKESTSPLYGI